MKLIWRLSIIFVISNCVNHVMCKINLTEYYELPKLYDLDDEDRCFDEYPDRLSHYCYIDVTIKPNATSDMWRIIKKYTDIKKYYRHDRLKRGLCLEWCQEKIKPFPQEFLETYSPELDFDRNISHHTIPLSIYENTTEYQRMYQSLINQCINLNLNNNYGLMAYSEIEYCYTSADHFQPDFLDMFMVILIIFVLQLIVLASFYDYTIQRKMTTIISQSEYYNKIPSIPLSRQMLLCFSLQRNFYKFTKLTKKSEKPGVRDELNSITTLRCICVGLVLFGHSISLYTVFPSINPQFIEDGYQDDRVVAKSMMNGQLLVQIFFTIAVFLFTFQFYEFREKHEKFQSGFFFKAIIYRYMRIVPVYAFVILLQATWMLPLSTEPHGKHYYEIERKLCRAYWWKNLLFISNYLGTDLNCVQQGWYLSADFQLFLLTLIVLMIIWKFPKITKILLVFLTAITLFIPAVIVYVKKIDPIFVPLLEPKKYGFWYDESYRLMYLPTHMYLGCTLGGAACGWAYYYIRKHNIDMKTKKWFVVCFWFLYPIGFLISLSSVIFFVYDFQKPSIWIAIYASFVKNIYGIMIGMGIIGFASKIGGIFRLLFNCRWFRPIGQISYCVYLIQTFVIAFFTTVKRPIYISNQLIAQTTISYFLLSYLAGVILYLTIENPCTNLMKILMGRNEKPAEKPIPLNNNYYKNDTKIEIKDVCEVRNGKNTANKVE